MYNFFKSVFKRFFTLHWAKLIFFCSLACSTRITFSPFFSTAREAEKEKFYHCIHNFVSHCKYGVSKVIEMKLTKLRIWSLRWYTRVVPKLVLTLSGRTCNTIYRNSNKVHIFCSSLLCQQAPLTSVCQIHIK